MKKLNQLLTIILFACFLSIQINAQNNSSISLDDRTEKASGLDDKAINQKLRDSMVQIKGEWQFFNRANRKPVYVLLVSTAQFAKAGVKITTDEKAVPVYVKTDNEYEPILVENKGQFNKPLVGIINNKGFFATADGFILTSRRAAAPWHSPVDLNLLPPGVLMSADLKQILDTNVPPPTKWIPSKTKPRKGTLGKLNIRVDSTGEYKGEFNYLTVNDLKDFKDSEAQVVSVSKHSEVGIIKAKVPGKIIPLTLSDNSEKLEKGARNIFIVSDHFSGEFLLPSYEQMDSLIEKNLFWAITATSISDILRTEESGNVMRLANNFTDSGSSDPNLETMARVHFSFYYPAYSGSPVFDKDGRVIGIYLSYDKETNHHLIVPIHYAKELIGFK